MKMNKYLILLFVGILLSSCGSDSDNDNGGNDPNDPSSANRLALGASANDLLSDDEFTTMTIEVIVDEDVQTSTSALNDLRQFIEDRTFKTSVSITQRTIPSPGLQPYSTEEVRGIEDDNRTAFNNGSDIAVSIIYLGGSSENDEGNNVTLGTAYRNTSIVIYKGTVNRVGAQANTPSASTIESATLQHEFGHLFGLVNLGTPLQSAHEDEGNAKHCNVEGCLMVASVEFGMGMIGMSQIPPLDDACIQDLQANGGR